MNILYSCLSRSWGGLEMSTVRGAKQLLEKNINAGILCYPGSKIEQDAEANNIKTYTLKVEGYFNPLQIFQLKKILAESNFDIIHSHASQDLWVLVPALKLLKKQIPLILTKRVGSFVVKKDFMHNYLYKNISLAIAISNVLKKNLFDTTALTENKIKVIHNGIDTKKFDPANVDNKVIRKEFKISDDNLVIGFIGRFTWGKGHEELVEAAKILSNKYSNLIFLTVGEASRGEKDYEEKIKSLVKTSGLEDKFIFTGYRKDTPELIAAMDIFLFPSHSEAFGNVLVEAMAMEKPTVASASDGVLDIAVDGKTSLLFEKQNGTELAEKTEDLIKNSDKRIALGKAGRERVLERFNKELQLEKLIEVYNKF